MTTRLAAIVCTLALVTTPASAQTPFPSDATVHELLQQLVEGGEIRGIVVGLLDGTGARRVIAYGDPGPGALPLDGDSVFEIGSMTKVFTGILLAEMVRRGEADLADPLAELLPSNVRVPTRNGKQITLLDLTTHYSGLPYMPTNLVPANPENPFADYTVRRMYGFLSSYELPRDPGDSIEYSNIGMALLGHALALRAGTTYETLISDRILRPLRLTHTAVMLTPWMRAHLARGHDRDGNPVANWDMIATAGMGGLRSTANDMLTFAAANLSSQDSDLSMAMHDSLRSLHPAEELNYPGMPIAFREGRIGFNWFISRPRERRVTWTIGLTGGYSTFLGLDVERRRAVVVLTNTGLNPVDYLGFHLLDPTVPLPRGHEPTDTMSPRRQAAPMTVAIRNVTAIDVTDGSLSADRTVLIAGKRIRAVGPADELQVPDDADVVEGAGGYLIPGLWDMHVHSVANVALDTAIESVTAMDWHFPLFLAWGITGVRDMNDGTGDVTLKLSNAIKRRLASGDLPGPRFLAAGPSIDGYPHLGTNSFVVRTAAEARAAVDALADAGADHVKPYENLSRDAYFAVVDQARRRGLPVAGHVPFRITPEEAADAGQRTAEHLLAMATGCATEADAERERFARVLSGYAELPDVDRALAIFRHERALYDSRDPAACGPTIRAYLRNGMAEAPSLVGYHHFVNAEEILSDATAMRLVPRAIRRNWETRFDDEDARIAQSILRPLVPLQAENTRLLSEAGVMLLAATDVGIPTLVPGLSLHDELELLVDAGLTPLQSLQAATLNPARILDMTDSLGTIESDKLADLVLLDANPLEDIRNTRRIRAVIADGRLYRRADLDRLLATAEALDR